MKKLIAVLLVLTVAAVFAACGKASAQPETEPAAPESETVTEALTEQGEQVRPLIINAEPFTVTAADGFDNAGVTELQCDADETYSFKADGTASWEVYVLSERFTDGARYLAQAQTPALIGDGELEIKAGSYIYILCSDSAFSTDAPSDSFLEINYAE